MATSKSVRIRIIVLSMFICLALLLIIIRIGYFQIVTAKELKNQAYRQYISDQAVTPKRGNIYDINGKKLAANIGLDTVEVIPQFIDDDVSKDYAKKLSQILHLDEDKVFELISSDKRSVVLKRWIDKDTTQKLRDEELTGVLIVDDTKRFYPFDNLLSHVIGNTNVDNIGQYGIEGMYDDELTGIPGRSIKFTYGSRKSFELPYTSGKEYEAEDGLNVVLTIDEVIQSYSERLAYNKLIEYKAKRVSILVMDPKTGELLSMVSKPDYNPNDRTKLLYDPKKPWIPLNNEDINKINSLDWADKKDYIYNSWSNFNVSGTYEPGSTFKLITTAATLEESKVDLSEKFFCDGYAEQIKGATIKCWSYLDPHGEQTLAQGIQNSCNEVLVELALRLKNEKLYEYIRSFGFGEKSGIDLPSEENGIVTTPENINNVELATISFGQGINVTPIQLISSIASFGNDGNLMIPKIVKKLTDKDGNEVVNFEPEIKRKVVSKDTAHTMLDIMESVVTEGTGKKAYLAGYRVGGKTGTAQKIIDGKYDYEHYIASFVALAPINDPKFAVLVIVDEPGIEDTHGGSLAGPIVREILKKSFNHYNIPPVYNEEEAVD